MEFWSNIWPEAHVSNLFNFDSSNLTTLTHLDTMDNHLSRDIHAVHDPLPIGITSLNLRAFQRITDMFLPPPFVDALHNASAHSHHHHLEANNREAPSCPVFGPTRCQSIDRVWRHHGREEGIVSGMDG